MKFTRVSRLHWNARTWLYSVSYHANIRKTHSQDPFIKTVTGLWSLWRNNCIKPGNLTETTQTVTQLKKWHFASPSRTIKTLSFTFIFVNLWQPLYLHTVDITYSELFVGVLLRDGPCGMLNGGGSQYDWKGHGRCCNTAALFGSVLRSYSRGRVVQ